MSEFLLDPVIIISFCVALVGVGIWWKFRNLGESKREDEKTTVFIFPRPHGFIEDRAKTFDGLVTYETGGFVEDSNCVIPLYYGRAGIFGTRNYNASRERTSVYITRPGDASPLNATKENFDPDVVGKERFDAYSAISVEREVNRGKLDAAKTLLTERMIAVAAIAAVFMVIITWSIVIVLPLTPYPVKSAGSSNPTNPTPMNPTPFVPTNYQKIPIS